MRYTCFHCGGQVVWDNDFSFDDVGIEWFNDNGDEIDGIVQFLHCANCEAEIEYRVPIGIKDSKMVCKECLGASMNDCEQCPHNT